MTAVQVAAPLIEREPRMRPALAVIAPQRRRDLSV